MRFWWGSAPLSYVAETWTKFPHHKVRVLGGRKWLIAVIRSKEEEFDGESDDSL